MTHFLFCATSESQCSLLVPMDPSWSPTKDLVLKNLLWNYNTWRPEQ